MHLPGIIGNELCPKGTIIDQRVCSRVTSSLIVYMSNIEYEDTSMNVMTA